MKTKSPDMIKQRFGR